MDKFEEYKYFGERALQQSLRRQNTSQIYLTVNTAIFGIMALLIKDSGLQGWNLVLANLPLFIVGLLVSAIWLTIIIKFKKHIGWYYEQLCKMEQEIEGSYQFFSKESNAATQKSKTSFSDLEAYMPKIFIGLYLVYAIGMMLAVKLGVL
jgi:hypothetical protein